MLELVAGRSVSIAEVDAAYQVVVDSAVRLPSNSACWRCLSGRECDGERSGFYHFQTGDTNILYNRIHLVTPAVVVFSLLWGGVSLEVELAVRKNTPDLLTGFVRPDVASADGVYRAMSSYAKAQRLALSRLFKVPVEPKSDPKGVVPRKCGSAAMDGACLLYTSPSPRDS